jgi:5-methylcytosine-specific restriction endonuclease McrA
MANPDLPINAFQRSVMPSRIEARRDRKAAKDTEWRAVCRLVDARDKGRCRVCGYRCDPDAMDLLRRAHRHHITYRSAGGPDSTQNLILLCPRCHELEHRHVLDVRGDGDAGIEVWRNDEAAGWYLSQREIAVGHYEHD